MNLPNCITAIRLLLAPLVVALIIKDTPESLLIALVIMGLAEFSDFLDGYLARKMNCVSLWGRFFDPLCDVFFHLSLFFALSLVGNDLILFGVSLLILFRELLVAYVRAWSAGRGLVFGAMMSGKIKAGSQATALFCLVFFRLLMGIGEVSESLFLIVCVWCWFFVSLAVYMTIRSLIEYCLFARKVV